MKNKLMSKMKANKDTSLVGNKFKSNYDRNLWSEAMLRIAVKKGELSTVEFKSITGNEY